MEENYSLEDCRDLGVEDVVVKSLRTELLWHRRQEFLEVRNSVKDIALCVLGWLVDKSDLASRSEPERKKLSEMAVSMAFYTQDLIESELSSRRDSYHISRGLESMESSVSENLE